MQEQVAKAKDTGFACVEAEGNILNRMVTQQGAAEEYAPELMPTDFSNGEYARIFKIIQLLVTHKRQVDIVTIKNGLDKMYPNEVRPDTLKSIAKQTEYTVANWQDVKDHVRIVKELSTRRKAIRDLEGLVAGLRDPTKDVGDTLAEISEAADRIEAADITWVTMAQVLMSTYDYIEKRQRGEIVSITTGINSLDKLIGGFFGGEVTVVAARPSVGKSAFGVNVALEAATKGFKVGVVSCEMQDVGLGQRILSKGAMVDGMEIRRADIDEKAWQMLAAALERMSPLPIEFLFDCLNVEDVVNTVRKKVRRHELDMLIIDYIQFMETKHKFDADHLRVGYISHALKRLAKTCNIPVIVLAQVNRAAEGRMPSKADLKDSGTIEQDADGIIFLHKPESDNDPSIYKEDKDYWRGFEEKGFSYLAIGVAKQRNGAIGQCNVLFQPAFMRYHEIARQED